LPLPRYLAFERRRPSEALRSATNEAFSDRARVVTATAFRRLQTKAQVFSLEKNAAVRSRLTHTLEVALYGQLIASLAARALVDSGRLDAQDAQAFVTVVESACLLHDVGNPPFGHLGEFAIQEWFTKTGPKLDRLWRSSGVEASFGEKIQAAYRDFDGNPQGFRIVTKLQWLHDEFGLNLSAALLGASLKYPIGIRSPVQPFATKIGFFPTEDDAIAFVCDRCDLQPSQRHPLAFLMESADDIAYCLSDIEDALEKHIISEDFFLNGIPPEAHKYRPGSSGARDCTNSRFIDFRIALTRAMVETAAKLFIERYDEITSGHLTKPLLSLDAPMSCTLESLKTFSQRHIFSSPEAVDVELSGYHVVQKLLTHLFPLLSISTSDFSALFKESDRKPSRRLPLENRLATLLPTKHRLAYQFASEAHPNREPVYRTQLLVDYVSGMTDVHALQVFRTLTAGVDGIEL
jgi:dGTPase